MTEEPKVEKCLLNRRSYLRTAAGATALAAFGKSAAASESEDEYEVVEVPAGQTHRVNLDDGEVLENVLFDISARNARFQVRARANDWTIRNVGVVGRWDSTQSSFHPFILEVPDPDAEGVVENVHFGTTTASDADYGNGPGGPYVFPEHAGHITFDRVWLQHFQDNGIYASPPGLPHGNGGTVEIRNCYAYRCGTANFRLGSTGSVLRNSVSIGGYRGYWGQLNETDVVDCDFLDNTADVAVGAGGYVTGHDARVTLRESCWNGAEWTHASGARISGDSVGTPERRVPEGCPTSPEEAAAGEGGSGGEIAAAEPYVPSGEFTLRFSTNDYAEYLVELEADAVEPGDSADTHDHEYQDRAFEHDGRWYVHGHVATGGSDSFHVEDGEVLRIGQLEGASEIRADGERLDLEAFDEIESVPGSDGDGLRTLEVAGQFRYRVEVDGEIEPSEEHARWVAEGEAYGDDWAEWWLSGSDDARTVWEFTGEITALEVDDHDGATEIRTLAVDGDDVDPDDY